MARSLGAKEDRRSMVKFEGRLSSSVCCTAELKVRNAREVVGVLLLRLLTTVAQRVNPRNWQADRIILDNVDDEWD